MIESLRIENWAIVEQAELELGPGLNVVTGETGTGKSIVLGALSLLTGARASADVVRAGTDRASVEAVFSVDRIPGLVAELRRRELDRGLDCGELVVQRSISGTGRSRGRVAGELVPATTLADLFAGVIEISSQHSSQSLLRPDTQGHLLDEAGDLLDARAEVEQRVREARQIDAELATLCAEAEERARRLDFLAFQVAEIDAVGLVAGEIDELDQRLTRLAHADRLLASGAAACSALVGHAEAGGVAESGSAGEHVGAARRALDEVADLDPRLAELADRLRACNAELIDIAADVERSLQNVDADPARLAEVEDRLGAIDALRRKYGQTEQDILGFCERARAELASIAGADTRIEELASQRSETIAALGRAAAGLSRGRARAARKLSRLVTGSLDGLAMVGARFEVVLTKQDPPQDDLPCGPSGAERAEFRFAATPGEPVRPLQRVASGGELSRIALAVRNALRKSGAGMVLVFDEVDAGIGGRVAERVGRALSELAQHHQVLCITHLPQIAAFGDVHFRVRKVIQGGRTTVIVERIDRDARIDEIARMAGGEEITDATREHAVQLMQVRSQHN